MTASPEEGLTRYPYYFKGIGENRQQTMYVMPYGWLNNIRVFSVTGQ